MVWLVTQCSPFSIAVPDEPHQPLWHLTVCDFICESGWCDPTEQCSSYEAIGCWRITGWAMKVNYKANGLAIRCQRLCLVMSS